jgi:hypothetical protein
MRLLQNLAAIVLMLTIVAAHRRAAAFDMWSTFREGESHRTFCANYPQDDRCNEQAASTLLFLCEDRSPESLGRCHGALHAYALDGRDLAEWLCVPKATLNDYEQLRRLFMREADRMPEILQRPARQVLYYAVAKAFPCPLRVH